MKCQLLIAASVFIFLSCSSQSHINKTTPSVEEKALAFPGAEGFGKFTSGGRGGKVMIVSNLDDSGPGSLRKAAESTERRIIVFAVSGTIHLTSKLVIKGNATIAGQTAPGDGICLADYSVGLGGDNIIIRYMRFRMGDRYQRGAMVDGTGSDDAFGASKRKNIIIDHCSMSWSTDEVCSVYGGDSTTLQWNIISEPLNYSYHFETGDKDWEHHGYGGIWGGSNFSAYHNLFAHCVNRNPRFNGTRLGATQENADFRYNVIYNWGGNNIYGGEAGEYNIVNNYFKYGPSTAKSVRYRIVNPSRTKELYFGNWYVSGNFVDEAPDVSANNWLGIHMGKSDTEADKIAAVSKKEFAAIPIPLKTAQQAYRDVLQHAGASYKRDTLDQRIMNDVRNRTGTFIDVQGGFAHGTDYEQTKQAWPVLQLLPAARDSDLDGMPDEWETTNGLNAANATDAATFTLDKNYSNIEVYINSIVK